MKSILISVHPQWCEKIFNKICERADGAPIYEKSVEVRKTRPKIETPFKCYVYMTAGDASYPVTINNYPYICHNNGGREVIGEFICDKIEEFTPHIDGVGLNRFWYLADTCLKLDEMRAYLRGKVGYRWHIADRVTYDKPKELREFKKAGFMTEENWLAALYPNTHCHYEAWAKKFIIKSPPQSWCYVEELTRGTEGEQNG